MKVSLKSVSPHRCSSFTPNLSFPSINLSPLREGKPNRDPVLRNQGIEYGNNNLQNSLCKLRSTPWLIWPYKSLLKLHLYKVQRWSSPVNLFELWFIKVKWLYTCQKMYMSNCSVWFPYVSNQHNSVELRVKSNLNQTGKLSPSFSSDSY